MASEVLTVVGRRNKIKRNVLMYLYETFCLDVITRNESGWNLAMIV